MMFKLFFSIVLISFSINVYSESLKLTYENLLPEETSEEKKGKYHFDVAVQVAGHNFSSSKGLGENDDLSIKFSRNADLELEGSYYRNSLGVYANYRTDLDNPNLSLNANDTITDKESYDNFNLGGFYMYKDRAGLFVESEVDNTSIVLNPNLDIIYDGKVLSQGSEATFNISRELYKVGISNFSKKRESKYFDINVGLLSDNLKLPTYDNVGKQLIDSEYDGVGVFFDFSSGLKSRNLNTSTKAFSQINMGSDFQFSSGNISLINGKKNVNRYEFNNETEFHLFKNSSVSYISGSHGLSEENGWSNFGGVLAVGVAGFIGYAMVADTDSLIKEGIENPIPFKDASKSLAVNILSAIVIEKIGEKLFDNEDKSYMSDSYYGIKFNYQF